MDTDGTGLRALETGSPGYLPYEPQLVPKAIAQDVWTVDGPEVEYPIALTTLPCPTRMTVIRLENADLWLHSPVSYSKALADLLQPLGKVRFIVAPNTYHHLHVAAWAQAFPDAQVHASPDLLESKHLPSQGVRALSATPPPEWARDLDYVVIRLRSFVEVVFFHAPSRTLIVTDLMQNFEADRIRGRFNRWVLAMGGALGPIGTTSIEIRLAAIGHRAHVRAARQAIMRWQPVRVLLAHGKCYEADAVDEVRRAFRWAGK